LGKPFSGTFGRGFFAVEEYCLFRNLFNREKLLEYRYAPLELFLVEVVLSIMIVL